MEQALQMCACGERPVRPGSVLCYLCLDDYMGWLHGQKPKPVREDEEATYDEPEET